MGIISKFFGIKNKSKIKTETRTDKPVKYLDSIKFTSAQDDIYKFDFGNKIMWKTISKKNILHDDIVKRIIYVTELEITQKQLECCVIDVLGRNCWP